jgi:Lrp/AsnC family transcriptional regulator, regulator for asnA, asnC and gidA
MSADTTRRKSGQPDQSGRGPHAPVQFDETDRKILRLLRTDGRTSNVEIARQLGFTETTVRKRIANMLADGLVEIVAVPTPRLAGLTVTALIAISVQLKHLQTVADALVARPEVRYCGVSTGRYDIVIEAFFPHNEALLKFNTQVLGSMPGITDVETSLILKVEKFSYEWQFD